jgi:hypothetical protein
MNPIPFLISGCFVSSIVIGVTFWLAVRHVKGK